MIKLNKPGTEEIVEVILSETKYPVAFANKLAELMEDHTFDSEEEARQWLSDNPICLEIYYEKGQGLFAVESSVLEYNPEDIYSPYTRQMIVDVDWVDLSLPSGRLWAKENVSPYFSFNDAVKTFGENLPSERAWRELFLYCSLQWDSSRKGIVLTSSLNGEKLFLPAAGGYFGGQLYDNKKCGHYWSSTKDAAGLARKIIFKDGAANPSDIGDMRSMLSVRLCQEP